jgi:hypothetical protein
VCWHTRSSESLDGKQPHASEPNDREWWRPQERDGTETAMAKGTHCERRGRVWGGIEASVVTLRYATAADVVHGGGLKERFL